MMFCCIKVISKHAQYEYHLREWIINGPVVCLCSGRFGDFFCFGMLTRGQSMDSSTLALVVSLKYGIGAMCLMQGNVVFLLYNKNVVPIRKSLLVPHPFM